METDMVGRCGRIAVATAATVLAMSGVAQAETFFVGNGNDSGTGSLRAAITGAANTPETDDIINWLAPGVVTLQSPLPELPSVRIVGGLSTVRRATGAPPFRIFDIPASSTVTIIGLTVSGGQAEGGGNIANYGTLILQRATVRDGLAQGAGTINGGGIYSNGHLTLDRSRVTGNRAVASGSASGGGIFQDTQGTLTIRDSTLWDNVASSTSSQSLSWALGGAISTAADTLVSQSTITHNQAVGHGSLAGTRGGAIYAGQPTINPIAVEIEGSTLADNEGNGNIHAEGHSQPVIHLTSSILQVDAEPNCTGGYVRSDGFNVFQPACAIGPNPTDVEGDANLGPLVETPGFAPTRSPVWPSAAIDRGFSDAATDQRGNPRTIDHGNATAPPGGDHTDAGAVEAADTVAPETSIGGQPAYIRDATPTITFSADEQATIACRLDGQAVSCAGGSFTPAAPLADGPHTFTATATDRHGNVDPTPATRAFTVDTAAPETTVAAGPPAATNADPVMLTVEADEPGTLACTLDGAAVPGDCADVSLPSLAEGEHTFTATATDLAGNTDATPAERVFVVDRTAPETTITSGPPAGTRDAMASFTFTSSEPGRFDCALDGGAAEPCESPASFAGLTPGPHSVAVAASDAAGNVDATPATYGWTVVSGSPLPLPLPTPPGGLPPAATKLTVGELEVSQRLSRRTLRGKGLKASFRLGYPGARWTLELLRGSKRLARHRGRVTSSSGANPVVRLKPTRKAMRRLARGAKLTVRLVVTAPGQKPVRRTARVRLR
jgi:hypothetical protein